MLGYPHPDVMLEQMTSRQFAEWMAYYSLDPFGEERADLRAAQIACLMFNLWRGKGTAGKEVSDFMPYYEKPEQTPQEMMSFLRQQLAVTRGHNSVAKH